ncbi:uncharacterized protein LOC26535064 isoform X1 [Drosophila yakuba]|uniref:uncharacterized protein LOC26535064 isoform X1 n=2 Tax=Drosophila yakuba TaxID=7245 RepID=UPI0019308314|nr:uncharacterized protein LOC26535064 isoform X1 [Drosophila yakuba]
MCLLIRISIAGHKGPLIAVVHDKVSQHRPAPLSSALSSLQMLDNKLDFVQILPSDRSTRWCPSAMMVHKVERIRTPDENYTLPRANRKFV